MSKTHLPILISFVGGIAVALGLAWWWLVFSEVIKAEYIGYGQAATCIVGTSDLCSLAEALCKANHFLGIKYYSSELFWSGLATLSVGLILTSRQRSV
ncbi:MAG: hypothetical protein QM636_12510 [Rhizobium sp.]